MTEDLFIAIVSDVSGSNKSTVSLGSTLDDIGWDSLATISLLAKLEQDFGMSIDAGAFAKAVFVGDLLNALARA